MKKGLLTIIFSLLLLNLTAPSYAQHQEELIITTHYPAPLGMYNELGANKLGVDVTGVAVPSEFNAMQNGDAHIGRSLIIGAGGGSCFAYDELISNCGLIGLNDRRPQDGDIIMKGNLTIGRPDSELNGNTGGIVAVGQGPSWALNSVVNGPGDALRTTGEGAKFIWYPRRAALRAGALTGIGADFWNDANIGFYSVAFGFNTIASGLGAVVSGGNFNEASGDYSTVGGGGLGNEASGDGSTVAGGGGLNIASASMSTVSGGLWNTSSGLNSIVGGGTNNTASGDNSCIAGGNTNRADGPGSVIAGGSSNTASGGGSSILGGGSNTASGNNSVVSGGNTNTAGGSESTVSGGKINTANGQRATICGGDTNTAPGDYSIVLGGVNNTAAGDVSLAAGRNMQLSASADRTFVFGNDPNPVTINEPDAFIVLSNKVGIGTVNPQRKLHVIGDILATGIVGASCGQLTCSDKRLKTNVSKLDNVLERLQNIHGVTYEWNDLFYTKGYSSTSKKGIGIIAQELEDQFPELVDSMDNQGYKAIDYGKFTAVLLEAVKELKTENDELKKRVNKLEDLFNKKISKL